LLLNEVRILLRRMNGTAPGGLIPPLEPDFLGELFVLERMLRAEPFWKEKIDSLTRACWDCGTAAAKFFTKLAGDFSGRADQVARAASRDGFHADPERVEEVLSRMLLSAGEPDVIFKGGSSVLTNAVYFASRAGRTQLAGTLLVRLEAAGNDEELASDLATAWFGYAASGGLRRLSRFLPTLVPKHRRTALYSEPASPGFRRYYARFTAGGRLQPCCKLKSR
jgi:hypothetical protein